MGWVSVGVVFRVMAVWNLVYLWECVMLYSTLQSYYFHTFAMLSFSSPASLDVLLLIFALGEDLFENLKTQKTWISVCKGHVSL